MIDSFLLDLIKYLYKYMYKITMEEIKLKLIAQQARIPLSEAFYFLLPEEQLKVKKIFSQKKIF